ncbi:MAG: tail fiber domain-containing protein [Cyclobacteriaceae bacterium]
MKKSLLLLSLLCLCYASFAQKIPFQGKLTSDGNPVTGSREFIFTISESGWEETHADVAILDGYYAVILGSITPLPFGLFDQVDQVELGISVNGTVLSPVNLYAPLRSASFPRTTTIGQEDLSGRDTVFHINVNASVDRVFQVDLNGAGSRFAIRGNSTSTSADDDAFKVGVFGSAVGEGSGDHAGLYGQGFGAGLFNNGVVGRAGGPGNGATGYGTGSSNTGVYGAGFGNDWGNNGVVGEALGDVGIDNIGVVGISTVDNGSDTIQNKAFLARAEGPGINYGILSFANGGVENWAGFFEGNVNVNGELTVNGQPISASGGSDTLKVKDIQLLNEANKLRTHVNIFNDAGSVLGNGPNDSTNFILGSSGNGYAGGLWLYDSLRNVGAQLRVSNKGNGNLFTYNETQNNTAWIGTQGNNSGIMQIAAYDEAGVNTGAMLGYHPGGLPQLILETNNEGNGPFSTLVHLNTFANSRNNHVGELNISSLNRSLLGVGSGMTFSMNEQDQPFIHLKSGNDRNWDVRALLSVDSVGALGTAGRFELLGPLGNENNDVRTNFSVGVINDPGGLDPSGVSSEMFLWGKSTPNIQFGGKANENNDLPHIEMYGSTDDGGTWFFSNLSFNVSNDGLRDAGSFHMSNSTSGVSENTVDFTSNGNNNGGQLILNASAGHTIVQLQDRGGSSGQAQFYGTSGGLRSEVGSFGDDSGFLILYGPNGNKNIQIDRDPGLTDFGQVNVFGSNGIDSRVTAGVVDLSGDESGYVRLSSTISGNAVQIESSGISVGENPYTDGTVINYDGLGGPIFEMYAATTQTISIDGNSGSINASGSITADQLFSTDGSVSSSDKRLKKNIKPLENALENTRKLQGVSYKWKDENKSQETQIGVIAQELEEVYPEFVHTKEDGIKGVNYAHMVAILIEALKELDAKVSALETENKELKAQITKSSENEIEELRGEIETIKALLLKPGSSSQSVGSTNK